MYLSNDQNAAESTVAAPRDAGRGGRWATLALSMLALGVLGGCAHQRNAEIPVSAHVFAAGSSEIAAQAPSAGRAYVYDQDTDKLMYSSPIEQGDMIRVDVRNSRITINDKVVSQESLRSGDQYKIFIDRAPGERMSQPAMEPSVPPSMP